MSLSPAPTDQAREQAAGWFARLKTRETSSADLQAFRIWRKTPGHKEAYDEVVAFWIVLWLVLPAGFWMQLAAFALFRFFDAVKPGPVGWADRLFHDARGWRGGLGIVLDDLVAAACALLVIALARAL